jgi:hypothetical protein
LCALSTAHLNRLSTDLDLDNIRVQAAITGGTSSFRHDFSPFPGNPGETSRPRTLMWALSESLAIFEKKANQPRGGALEQLVAMAQSQSNDAALSA